MASSGWGDDMPAKVRRDVIKTQLRDAKDHRQRRRSVSTHSKARRHSCTHPAATYIGILSYPLYLWHWPIIVLFRHTCGMQPAGNKVGAIAATIGGSLLTYHGLEMQVRKWNPKKNWHIFAVMVPVLGFA